MFLIYTTINSREKAKKLAINLIEKNLACCANIIPVFKSIYKWEGKINEDKEYVLIVKVTEDKVDVVEREIKSNHPYEIPAIIRIKVDKVNDEFLKWCSIE